MTTSVRSRGVSRRDFLLGSASLGAILTGRDPGGAPPAPPDAGFPRTVATSRGPVEIPARPQRIVTLAAEVDAVVALGLAPVAMVQSFNAPIRAGSTHGSRDGSTRPRCCCWTRSKASPSNRSPARVRT